MQKILLLLSLIYFASSATLYCENYADLPDDKNDCFDREIQTGLPQCCFVHLKIDKEMDLNICCPGAKKAKKDDIKKTIDAVASTIEQLNGHTYEVKDYKCPDSGSYIKVGLILLTLLLF